MEIQGHRGSKGTHPENTLAAFAEAIDAGADGIEMDLRLTSDGAIVVFHNQFSNQTLEELRRLDPQIPTLEEVFALVKDSSITLNLEIKPGVPPKPIFDAVQKAGFQKRVYYSSFDPEILLALRKLDPQCTLGFIYDKPVPIPPGVQILSMHHTLCTKIQGYKIIPWTVNDPKRWDELIEMGVDGIITDFPRRLLEYCASRKEKESV